jgi:hypothetical protein
VLTRQNGGLKAEIKFLWGLRNGFIDCFNDYRFAAEGVSPSVLVLRRNEDHTVVDDTRAGSVMMLTTAAT